MSTVMEQRAEAAHRRHVKVAQDHLAGAVVVAGVWFWVILVLIGIMVAVLDRIPGSEVEGGLGQITDISQGSAPRIFLMVIGIIMVFALVPRYLAGGGTRRALVDGAVRAAFFSGFAFAAVSALLNLAERFVLDRIGLVSWAESGEGRSVPAVLGAGIVMGAWFLAGMAISLLYQRFVAGLAARSLPARAALLAGVIWVVPLVPVALAELGLRGGPLDGLTEAWLPGGFLGAVIGLVVSLAGGFVVVVVLDRLLSGFALAPVASTVHIKVR